MSLLGHPKRLNKGPRISSQLFFLSSCSERCLYLNGGDTDEDGLQYGGYSFTFVEAWPVGWGYDDDFFIDFIDGQYYLIDLRHPEVRLALVVVL
jgi:hypothetical protein